jgi:TonB-linked SusC/RagA family outer membrane protein
MKITAFILLIACLAASAAGHSQKVTLSVKGAPLEKVLNQIKTQTGLSFLWDENILKQSKPVTASMENVTIEEAMTICLRDQPLTFSILQNLVVIKPKRNSAVDEKVISAIPPLIDVHGRIVNENGQPVAGANITVKGTSLRVASDEDGYFTLRGVEENATLLITAVNLDSREIKVAGKTELSNISVKIKITEGAAVVVEANTGYQKVKPNETTGSVVVVDNKKLNEQKGTNILDRLKDIVPGIYFNVGKNISNGGVPKKTDITIRGLGTISGPLDPLIILDNFPYEGDINNINPVDVESITILKDAAATSIYGAKGGNGVIVITTKRGRFNQKLRVEANSSVIVSKEPDLYSISQISVGDYIDVEQYLFNKGFDFGGATVSTTYGIAMTPAVEIFLKRKNGQINASDSATSINSLKNLDSRSQYAKYSYQNAITQQHSLSLTGGSDNLAWLIGGNYDKSEGFLGEKNDRINLRINNSYKPFKNLQINLAILYTNNRTYGKSNAPYNSITINGRYVPYIRLADDNGNAVSVPTSLRDIYTDTVGGGKLLNWKYYPLDDNKHNSYTGIREDLLVNLGVNYKLSNAINFEALYQYQNQKSSSNTLSDIESFYTRSLINTFSQLNRQTGVVTYIVPKGGILTLSNSNIKSQSARGQLNFHKKWSDHEFSSIVGSEIRKSFSDGGDQRTIYGYNENPLTYGSVDFVNQYPEFLFGSLQNIPGAPKVGVKNDVRFVSLFGNASYSFKQKYTVSASGRKDASNTFGLTTNDKWTPLWSAGFGWELSKERFYHVSAIPFVKIRTTFGYSGNVDPTKTALALMSFGSNSAAGFPTGAITRLSNPSLKWERVRQISISLDFKSAINIISGTISVYFKKGSNLYASTPYDYTTWGVAPTIPKNVADMQGRGIDIDLVSKNIDRTFKWNTELIYNYNSNKTTKYYTDISQNLSTLIADGNTISPVIGKPLYAIAAYKWGGLNSVGDPQGYVNGILSTDYDAIFSAANTKGVNANVVYVGPSNPTNFGALINRFEFKRFSASLNFTYKFGYYFRKSTLSYTTLFFNGLGNSDFSRRWQNPGDEAHTTVPSMVYTNYPQFTNRDGFYANSEVNVLKGDHIRVQYININYALLSDALKRHWYKDLNLYCNVSNLGIIWRANKEKIDPDYPLSIVPSKTITFGLRLGL